MNLVSLFLFLLVGSQLAYVYGFTETNGFQTFEGNIYWNLTWVGEGFNATGVVNYTFINGSSVRHLSYNLTSSKPADWYTLTTDFFPYFVVSETSNGYYNSSIPSITLYSGSNYIIISAQYGVPLAGRWSGFKGQLNTTFNFTLIKSPFSFYRGGYEFYDFSNVSNSLSIEVLTPKLVNYTVAHYSVYSPIINKTVELNGVSFVGKGFLTIVFPRYAVSGIGGLAVLLYNGSKYFVSLSPYEVGYANTSNPFLVTILGNDVYMFFPYGGNATLIFGNPNATVSLTSVAQSSPLPTGQNYAVYLGIAAAVIVVVVTALLLGRAFLRRGR